MRRGTAVVLVEPLPQLEHLGPSALAGIVDSLIGLLTGKPNAVRVPQEARA